MLQSKAQHSRFSQPSGSKDRNERLDNSLVMTDEERRRSIPSSCKTQKPSSNRETRITVSRNEKVQAKKVENLIKAAAESLKPPPPFIKMQNVNSMVRDRMFGKGKKVNNRSKKRQKTTLSLLEQAEASTQQQQQQRSLESSESDSD